jgi:Mce-associated membrane protein
VTADDELSVPPAVVNLQKDPGPTEITESGGVEVTDGADAACDALDGDQSDSDVTDAAADAAAGVAEPLRRRTFGQSRRLAHIVLPVLALLLAVAAGFFIWKDISARATDRAYAESMQAAKDSTVRLLSYKPDTVEAELTSARDLLTATFKDSYTQLTNDVVIPGAKEKKIAAVASVPAVASVEASPKHAVVLVFVNQTVTVGDGAPTATASSVKVTLDKVDGRWLISQFDPV